MGESESEIEHLISSLLYIGALATISQFRCRTSSQRRSVYGVDPGYLPSGKSIVIDRASESKQ